MRPSTRDTLLIGVVGPCGSGKSTLVPALEAEGSRCRHIAQEHSYVPYMWQRLTAPDLLIFLGASFIQEKVHYTEIAKRIGLEGTVYIQAKIDKNGDVVAAIVLKGLGAGLDEEALNAVKSTKFVPVQQRGKDVKVKMVIPIKFVLK